MKVSIKKDETETKEPMMELALEQDAEGVRLIGKDESGRTWYILRIDRVSGCIIRSRNIYAYGWPIDSKGRLNLDKE